MRLNPYATRPDAYRAVLTVLREIDKGSLERSLRSLVELRVSQVNRCAFCLAMHADGARAAGITQRKLDTLAGWRDDASFTPRERAALALAEAMSLLDATGVPDDTWSVARDHFTDEELGDLLYLVGVINLFNRLNVATEFPADAWRGRRDSRSPGKSAP
jgi:AhpD family alkylhydroperoxidase